MQGQTTEDACPNCGKRYKRKNRTFTKVLLGVLLAGLLLIGGCIALIGGVATEVDEELQREQNANAITNQQARGVELGTTRREVEERFGPPKSDQESENQGLGEDSCIYYNVRGGEALDQWQFCFEGSGKNGKLRSKNRL